MTTKLASLEPTELAAVTGGVYPADGGSSTDRPAPDGEPQQSLGSRGRRPICQLPRGLYATAKE